MNYNSIKLCSMKNQLIKDEYDTLLCIQKLINLILDEITLYQFSHDGNVDPYFNKHIEMLFDKIYQSKMIILTDQNNNIIPSKITTESAVIGYGLKKIFNTNCCYSTIIKMCQIFAENNDSILPLNRLLSNAVNLNEANVITYLESFCQLRKCITDMILIISNQLC